MSIPEQTKEAIRGMITSIINNASTKEGREIIANQIDAIVDQIFSNATFDDLAVSGSLTVGGNVGVNQSTPTVWSGDFRGISINQGGASVGGSSASSSLFGSANAYFSDTGWKFVNDGRAAVMFLGEDGSWNIYESDSSGVSGDEITFVEIAKIHSDGVSLSNLPTYADDASAGTGGLVTGDVYKTSSGEVRIKL